MHNARWMYYCLGHEATSFSGGQTGGATFTTNGAIAQGESSFLYTGGSAIPTISGAGTEQVGAGDYIIIIDTDTTDIKTYRETASDGTWPTNGANSILSKAEKQEIRRIVAISDSSGSGRIWVDDPFNFAHSTGKTVKFLKYESDSSRGSPHMTTTNSDYGLITNPVERILFSRTNIPSFAMEVSIRRRDTDSNEGRPMGRTATPSNSHASSVGAR